MSLFIKCLLLFAIPCGLYGQNDANNVYKILDEAFIKQENNSDQKDLIVEFENYLLFYPNSAHEDEALFRLAQLYELNDDVPHQLFTLIKLKFLHNNSPLSIETNLIIDSLVTYNISILSSDLNDHAIKELANISNTENHQQLYLDFLSYIHFSNIKSFYNFFIEEAAKYKKIYNQPGHSLDAIAYWQAETYKRIGNIELAIVHFKILISLYGTSEFASLAMFEMAKLNIQQKDKVEAAKNLIEIITQFPESSITGDAQYLLAQLYEVQFKDLREAYTNYQMLVETFPENSYYIASLFKMGDLSIKFNNPDEAIRNYKRVVESTQKQQDILNAYEAILKVQLEILHDFEQAANTHILIAQTFPKAPEAPSHLLLAAKIFINKLNKESKSKELIEILSTQYKGSQEAIEANILLNKN